jgi:hypothetical protein
MFKVNSLKEESFSVIVSFPVVKESAWEVIVRDILPAIREQMMIELNLRKLNKLLL